MPSRSHLSFAAPAYNPDPNFKTAIELASAPGLSLKQRFQNLMESVDIPNLVVNPPGRAPNEGRAYQKMLALQTFKSTPQYQLFKNRVTHTLTELDRISNSACTVNQRNTNFQALGHGLWQPVSENESSRFGTFQVDLYQQACPDTSRLLRMHTFAQQRPDLVARDGEENARATIRELSQRLDVCAPGIIQHFDEAVNTVRQATFTPSLLERFEAMRILIVRNAIAEFIHQNPDATGNRVGNEVHKVAAWQNHFSRSLHLPFIDDVFASPSYVENRSHQNRLSRTLIDLQTPSVISTVLATQILVEAHDLWSQAQATGTTDFPQHCMAIIEAISNKHGPVEPHALVNLPPLTVEMPLYKGALQYNWTCQRTTSARLAINNPAFTSPNREHGIAYIDVMAKCAPHLLTDTLCKNIDRIECPEVVIKFHDAGAIFTATHYGQPSALRRLMLHPKDSFVAIVLEGLSQRGVSLQELADPRIIQYLREKNFVHSVNVLISRSA